RRAPPVARLYVPRSQRHDRRSHGGTAAEHRRARRRPGAARRAPPGVRGSPARSVHGAGLARLRADLDERLPLTAARAAARGNDAGIVRPQGNPMRKSRSAVNEYTQVGASTRVMHADPHALILMLMNGALDSMAAARGSMERGAVEEKG